MKAQKNQKNPALEKQKQLRLTAALRANLRKRKLQVKGREEIETNMSGHEEISLEEQTEACLPSSNTSLVS